MSSVTLLNTRLTRQFLVARALPAVGKRAHVPRMTLDLTDEEAALRLKELSGIIDGDRYFLSPRIKALKAIRAKISPKPAREPPPPPLKPLRPAAGDHGEKKTHLALSPPVAPTFAWTTSSEAPRRQS